MFYLSKLAVNGGIPVRKKEFPSWPYFNGDEKNALERVLYSGKWGTRGPEVKKFEKRFSSYQNAKYGLAVTNGTVTMEIALRALGIGYGDEVIIPPYTFYASASAVFITGATPVFADIEENTYNIDPEKIKEVISPYTKAIIPVHIGGRPANMDKIMKLAGENNLYVIEDCAHAHGSEWNKTRVGSIGNAGSFSFQKSKNITAGEGGFITTNNYDLYKEFYSIHHCGRSMNGAWYGHSHVGSNMRMTDWQAAVLDIQLNRLDDQITLRENNACYLTEQLSQLSFIETMNNDEKITRNSYHLYLFKFISDKCKGISRKQFVDALNAEGIPVASGYTCLYKQKVFQTDYFKRITGSKISYDKLYLENTKKAAEEQGMWFNQKVLLEDKLSIDLIIEAMSKVYKYADEL